MTLRNILKTSEDQVIKPSVVIRSSGSTSKGVLSSTQIRAVSGFRASAKFRNFKHTFQGGDIQRSIGKVPGHYRSRNAKETRRNTNTIPRKVRVNTNRAGRTNADRYRETKRQLEMYRENKDMFNRKHALKNMRIRGLPPRPSTILKYNITDEEIADCCKRV
ncbi:unnamed protein product [Bathycoccus prasinos]